MLRTTVVAQNPFRRAWRRFSKHMTSRDPLEKHVRMSWIIIEMWKRTQTYIVAGGILVSFLYLQQLENPDLVRTPINDGRSLVT